jgi:hypothetical protein
MSKMFDYLKAAAGEASLSTKLGFWRQAVSGTVDNLVDLIQLVTGGGLLPATGTTGGSNPLSGYVTALLQTGDEVFVQGINEIYYFDATSALTADQLNIVDAVGPGQFLRLSSVIVQADWYVDSVSGDDENPGTAALPLQTLPELFKRWSGKALLSSITAATINLLGTFPTQVLSLSGPNIARGQSLVLSGMLTTVDSGTITTYTARSAAGDTSATILADISFAAHANRRIRLTSGANSGATATVLFDLGANTCRVSGFSGATGSAVVPANGNTFVIETYDTTVGGVTIDTNGGGIVRVDDLEVVAQASTFQPNFLSPFIATSTAGNFAAIGGFFNRCRFSGANTVTFTGGCGFNACTFTAALGFRLGRYYIQHGALMGANVNVAGSSLLLQGGYVCAEGLTGAINLSEQASVTQGIDLQVFRGSGSSGVNLSGMSVWEQTTGVFIYGSSNTFTNAFLLRSGCALLYFSNKPTILGNNPGVNDIKLGGADLGWGGIPTITVANNAMAVLRA